MQSHWERNADRYYSLVPILVGLLFFYDFIFTSKNFYFRDTLNFHYPLRRLLIDAYAHGQLPLWNPFIYLGQPMLANPNYMAFYPTNLLHLFLPFDYAFKLHFIIHPILAGLGAFWLQRRLAIAGLCALGGALAYEFSGTVLSFLNLYNLVPAVALLPWIGWAFLKAVQAENSRSKMLFGILLALQVVAFEPLTFECTALLILGLAVWHYAGSARRTAAIKSVLGTCIWGGLFAFGLAAIQVLPTLELLPRSMRGAGINIGDATIWSMHPTDLLNMVVPNLYGKNYTLNEAGVWGDVFRHGREAYLVSCFLGVSTILLAVLSLWGSSRALKWILGALALVGYGLAAGEYNPIYQWAFQHIPIFDLGRYPSKHFLLSALSISIMASLGLQVVWTHELMRKFKRNQLLTVCAVAIAAALFMASIALYWKIYPQGLESLLTSTVLPENRSMKNFLDLSTQLGQSLFRTSLFSALCGIFFLLAMLWNQRRALVTGLFILIIVAELIPSNLQLTPLISNADFRFEPEVNQFISGNGPREPYRVFPPTTTNRHPMPDIRLHAPNRSSAWLSLFYRSSGQPFYGITNGIQYSLDHSVDYLNTADAESLFRAFEKLSDEDEVTLLQKINAPMILQLSDNADPRLQPLKTFNTFSDRKLHSYWLNQTISRCYFVPNARTVSSHEKALEEFIQPDFPFSSHVIMESAEPSANQETGAKGRVQILKYDREHVFCNVETMSEGYVVLLDSYYPGWKAFVDSRPATILRANYAFRAVKVPSGNHTVEFLFRPTSFYLGLIVSSLVALAGITIVIVRRRCAGLSEEP